MARETVREVSNEEIVKLAVPGTLQVPAWDDIQNDSWRNVRVISPNRAWVVRTIDGFQSSKNEDGSMSYYVYLGQIVASKSANVSLESITAVG